MSFFFNESDARFNSVITAVIIVVILPQVRSDYNGESVLEFVNNRCVIRSYLLNLELTQVVMF